MTNIETTNGSNEMNEMIGNTGWSWRDAASEAKQTAREHRLFPRNSRRRSNRRSPQLGLMVTNPARFERETGWTPEAALEMALECRKDARIFGRRGH
jgi:hypothetical protein